MKRFNKVLAALLSIALLLGVSVYAKTIVKVKHNNTKEEVMAVINKYPHSAFENQITRYDKEPSLKAPYKAGSLDKRDLDDALNAVKVVRFLAGVPYEHIKFTDELNNIAQHGAVLQASSGQFSHTPYKPADMSQEFYDLAYRGCNEANIFAGLSNISASVMGFIYDAGLTNLGHVGHRRWILKPGAENFGMGFAMGNTNEPYGGFRISMHVFDGPDYWECESDSYIAWPAAGDFPIQYFAGKEDISGTIDSAWSVNLGAAYGSPDRNEVVVKLTRKSDNKTWVFDKNTPSLTSGRDHFSVDNEGYGMQKAIVFRPEPKSLGVIREGDVFTVEISGIRDNNGKATKLTYNINFFDMTKATSGISVKLDGKLLRFDVPAQIINNRTMVPLRAIFEALGAEVEWNSATRTVTATKGGTVVIAAIGSKTMYVNNSQKSMDVAPVIVEGRTLVPARFVAEAFACDVGWDGNTRTVDITSNGSDDEAVPEQDVQDKPISSNQALPDGTYLIATKLNEQYALDIDGVSLKDCANLQLWERNDSRAQFFKVTHLGDGFYRIVSANSNKAIDAENGGTEVGTNVWQFEINNTPAQIWKIVPSGNDSFYIINQKSSLYLDVDNAWAANGTNVKLFTRNDAYDAQKWYFYKQQG